MGVIMNIQEVFNFNLISKVQDVIANTAPNKIIPFMFFISQN